MSTMHAWFVPYRRPVLADVEEWLEAKAAKGWILDGVHQWSSIRMALHEGEPATYRYVVDLQARPRPDYVPTYQDFGWAYLGRMSSVRVWRQAYDGVRPEAFTDADSLRARSRRFQVAAAAALALFVVGAAAHLTVGLVADSSDGTSIDHLVEGGVLAAAAALLGYVVWRIGRQRDR